MPERPRPIGVIVIGAALLGFAAVVVLIAVVFVVGFFLFEDDSWGWLALLVAGLGLVLAYLAFRVGRDLLREPPTGRGGGEIAMWAAVPFVWLALSGLNSLIEAWDDPFMGATLALSGLIWSGVLIMGAFYMRSRRVRAYFEQPSA